MNELIKPTPTEDGNVILTQIEYKLMVSAELIDKFIVDILEMDARDVPYKYQDMLLMLSGANEIIDSAIELVAQQQEKIKISSLSGT